MLKITEKNLKKLAVGSIRPEGWLRDELLLASELQKRLGVLPGLLQNGEWIDGESYPRFVRGLVLLAGALGDKSLKDKVAKYILPIFNSANEGGDFGPKQNKSLAPKIEAIKTLLCFYDLTEDDRVLPFLKKFFKNQFNTYSVTPTWYTSRARLLEEIPALEAVYRDTDLEWIQDLGEKLRDSSNDWFKLALKFQYKKPTSKYISAFAIKRVKRTIDACEKSSTETTSKRFSMTPERIEAEWKKKAHQTLVQTDGVNLAKAIKYPTTYGRFVGDESLKKLSLKLLALIDKYHGTATGMFASDFHLAGCSPTRGIDIEASVEMIESLVEVLGETGEYACADLLEKIVFNLIPAACFDDMSAVQDVLLVNQVEASSQRKHPNSENEFGNAFVTKMLSSGAISVLSAFPMFMQALCMTKGNELNFMTYAPCTIEMKVAGSKIILKEETGYPFRNTIVFSVVQAEGEPELKINFRAPKGTTIQLISGGQIVASGTKSISVKCILKTGSTFMLKLDIPLIAVENRDESMSLFKGSILMASKIPFETASLPENRCLLNLNFTKKWNYAPVVSKKLVGGTRRLYENEDTVVGNIQKAPFSFDKPPFELNIRSKNIINWDYDVNGFTQIPDTLDMSEETVERVYIPFGCARLHMAQFPKCYK